MPDAGYLTAQRGLVTMGREKKTVPVPVQCFVMARCPLLTIALARCKLPVLFRKEKTITIECKTTLFVYLSVLSIYVRVFYMVEITKTP